MGVSIPCWWGCQSSRQLPQVPRGAFRATFASEHEPDLQISDQKIKAEAGANWRQRHVGRRNSKDRHGQTLAVTAARKRSAVSICPGTYLLLSFVGLEPVARD